MPSGGCMKHEKEIFNEKLCSLETSKQDAGKFLTTNQGTLISDNQNTLKLDERGPSLLEDFIFREKITHFDHERIPERVVHARGSGAHGYFQPYQSMKEYTKANFLQDPSKITPVFVRFSTVAGFRGSADTVRDVRGFATKFYTEEGIFDLVGNNMPVFFIQDAIKFPDVIHAVKPEPDHEMPQASSAHNSFWDFISLTPESMHMILWLMSDRALPRSYSMMEGFGVHTFRLINESGKSRFVKFHWKPLNGLSSLLFEEAQIIGGKDPDFNRRDLWELIEKGHFPEFELGFQILEEDELYKVDFDILDPTKIWPEEDIPVQRIGKMVLNRNPDNFFAETEQVAFCPSHLVPGFDFTDDPLLQGRLFSYLDTQISRLGGPNFHEIPINQPLKKESNYQRDGMHRQTIHKNKVNYEPSSLGGGCPMQALWKQGGFATFAEKLMGVKIRKKPESFNDHYSQAAMFFNSMSDYEKKHIINAFRFELGKVTYKHIREKMIEHLNQIDLSLAQEVAKGIGVNLPSSDLSSSYTKRSPSLSFESHKTKSIKGRKVAILVADGCNSSQIEEFKKELNKEGVEVDLIAKYLGEIECEDGKALSVDKSFLTVSSTMYDAVFLPGEEKSVEFLLTLGDALKFVLESYRHCKTIGMALPASNFFSSSFIKSIPFDSKEPSTFSEIGIVMAGSDDSFSSFCTAFKIALAKHRHFERETIDTDKIPG